jgi:hypothetical protein
MDDRIDACVALKAGRSQSAQGWVSIRFLGVADAALSREGVLVADRGVRVVTQLTARSALAVVLCTRGMRSVSSSSPGEFSETFIWRPGE